jgi:hypothetical protein
MRERVTQLSIYKVMKLEQYRSELRYVRLMVRSLKTCRALLPGVKTISHVERDVITYAINRQLGIWRRFREDLVSWFWESRVGYSPERPLQSTLVRWFEYLSCNYVGPVETSEVYLEKDSLVTQPPRGRRVVALKYSGGGKPWEYPGLQLIDSSWALNQ